MITYKLLRVKNGKLYPLYVLSDTALPISEWIDAQIGPLLDPDHVKSSRGGKGLSLRPGFHSTLIPFTDWIGKRGADGHLYQRPDTVWCECEVDGEEQVVRGRNGLRTLPQDWYKLKLNPRQRDPWIISNNIKIMRILSHSEVQEICKSHGLEAQPLAGSKVLE